MVSEKIKEYKISFQEEDDKIIKDKNRKSNEKRNLESEKNINPSKKASENLSGQEDGEHSKEKTMKIHKRTTSKPEDGEHSKEETMKIHKKTTSKPIMEKFQKESRSSSSSSEQKETNSKDINNKKGGKIDFFEKITEIAKNKTYYEKEEVKNFNSILSKFYKKSIFPIISDLKNLDEKISEYHGNLAIRNTLLKMKEELPYFREIKGDGNCFYRATYFLYIETLLMKISQKSDLDQPEIRETLGFIFSDRFNFIECFCDANNESFLFKKDLLKETKLLKRLAIKFMCTLVLFRLDDPDKKKGFLDFFQRKINKNPCLDVAMVVFMRSLTMVTYNKVKSSKSYKEFLAFPYDNIIKEYDLEAQEMVLTLTAEALHTKLFVHSVDDKKSAKKIDISYDIIPLEKNGEDLDILHFYFRPGHYDCFYLKSYINEDKLISEKKSEESKENYNQNQNQIYLDDGKREVCDICKMSFLKNEMSFFKSKNCCHNYCHPCLSDRELCDICKMAFLKNETSFYKSENCGHNYCHPCLSDRYEGALKNKLDGTRCELDGNVIFDLKKLNLLFPGIGLSNEHQKEMENKPLPKKSRKNCI